MKMFSLAFGSALVLYVTLAGTPAWAHGEQRLGLEPDDTTPSPAGLVSYSFQIIDLKTKTILGDSDFEVLHEGKVHVFAFDPALKNLQHVHATYNGASWHADIPLTRDGSYWVWAEGQLTSDKTVGYGNDRIKVVNGDPIDPSDLDLSEIRIGNDGTSQVELAGDPIVKGQEVMLMLTFSRTDGSKPDISPYLGEIGHSMFVSEDEDWFSHDHVMDDMGMPMLHAKFPSGGNYRVWVQFMDGGVLKTVALAVAVSDSSCRLPFHRQGLRKI